MSMTPRCVIWIPTGMVYKEARVRRYGWIAASKSKKQIDIADKQLIF